MMLEKTIRVFWPVFLVFARPVMAQTIPFDLQDNLIRVPVTVTGYPAAGVIDTGTGSIGIDGSFADRVGIAAGKSLGAVLGAGPGAAKVQAIHVDAVVVGPARLTDVNAFAINTSLLSSSAGFPIEVLLGTQFFYNRLVSIDYRHRVIALDDPSKGFQCARAFSLLIESFGIPNLCVI